VSKEKRIENIGEYFKTYKQDCAALPYVIRQDLWQLTHVKDYCEVFAPNTLIEEIVVLNALKTEATLMTFCTNYFEEIYSELILARAELKKHALMEF